MIDFALEYKVEKKDILNNWVCIIQRLYDYKDLDWLELFNFCTLTCVPFYLLLEGTSSATEKWKL